MRQSAHMIGAETGCRGVPVPLRRQGDILAGFMHPVGSGRDVVQVRRTARITRTRK